jgi:transcription factor SPN1
MRKKELDSRIDSAGKLGRTRPKKRKKGDEDALDEAHDSVVRRLGLAMKSAADEDQLANASRQPATAKLRMLPEVMQVLQRTQLSQAIIDGNLLELVKIWLEPLPDKSLPALNIQHSFFEVLPKMDIDTVALKESGLGRIVLFYTKPNKRVTAPIKRAADSLVAQWSRPIIKRSASYRDRVIPTANIDSSIADRRPLKLNQVLQKQREEEAAAGIVKRNAVRIPERNVATYTVAPRNAVSSGMSVRMMEDMKSRKAQNDRARKIHRHLTQHAAKLHKQ